MATRVDQIKRHSQRIVRDRANLISAELDPSCVGQGPEVVQPKVDEAIDGFKAEAKLAVFQLPLGFFVMRVDGQVQDLTANDRGVGRPTAAGAVITPGAIGIAAATVAFEVTGNPDAFNERLLEGAELTDIVDGAGHEDGEADILPRLATEVP